ncbi:Response regulator receiver domain-containing protein [Loktanella atrilutea]|uniref:Response regulator receiver domain-containing protein n=1 Tax=Loktanella atrilutea TaxID=366533 RepID=A0A1M5F977_LOKAT|nr:response regulator [Loktanella atrilutea]SHF88036.1 Response regulator receiver domain-containing protein [Loktanella atrilutea]
MNSTAKVLPAILVVEDEPLIRMEAVDMIEDAGFRVYDAANADAALVLMELHEDIGILFTDIDMPGSMDGMELATHVRNVWPPVAIVIASGKVDFADMQVPEGSTFFPKPYPTEKIAPILEHIVDRLKISSPPLNKPHD